MPNLAGRRPSDVDNPAHKPLTVVHNYRPRAFGIEAWCAPNSHFLAGAAALDETCDSQVLFRAAVWRLLQSAFERSLL